MEKLIKPYPSYKPTNIQWIGDIPEHWSVRKIKYNTYIKGRVGWHGLTTNDYIEDGAYLVTGTDLIDGEVKWETCYHVSQERYAEDPYIQLNENDLLITKDGTIGKIALVKNLMNNATLNSGVFVARPLNSDYLTDYMYWALHSVVFTDFVSYYQKGTTINHLYQDTFENLPFLLPPISEQTAIANYLDLKTALIDTLIADKQKLIELFKEERIAIINEAVSGEGKGWKRKKLKYVLKINSGEGIRSEEIDFEGTYPVYGGNGIMGYTEKFNYANRDIIIGRVGAKCGNVRLVDGKKWISDNALVATIFSGYDLEYVSILLEAMNLNQHANQNAQPLITGTLVKDAIAFFPNTINEQIIIVCHVKTENLRIDTGISNIEKEIELLSEYRTALISEVVTGKICVV